MKSNNDLREDLDFANKFFRKKKQKLIKTIRNDSKYDKIYSELII